MRTMISAGRFLKSCLGLPLHRNRLPKMQGGSGRDVKSKRGIKPRVRRRACRGRSLFHNDIAGCGLKRARFRYDHADKLNC